MRKGRAMMKIFISTVVSTGAVLAVCIAVSACGQNGGDTADKGRALLQANCARCHAIGMDDKSPHESAPPFREVMKRYRAENLAEALAEGIVSGHPDMPEFVFEPPQIEEILVYLDSISPDGN